MRVVATGGRPLGRFVAMLLLESPLFKHASRTVLRGCKRPSSHVKALNQREECCKLTASADCFSKSLFLQGFKGLREEYFRGLGIALGNLALPAALPAPKIGFRDYRLRLHCYQYKDTLYLRRRSAVSPAEGVAPLITDPKGRSRDNVRVSWLQSVII